MHIASGAHRVIIGWTPPVGDDLAPLVEDDLARFHILLGIEVTLQQTTHKRATVGSRIAAIDIGSNSVRLVVAEVLPSGGYRVLDEERENTRLAASLTSTERLDLGAIDQTVVALRRFLSIVSGHGVQQVRAIATSAVRDAENGQDFCGRVQRELDLEVEVISPVTEARLAFLSVSRAFDVSGREVAVADIGGGSTEIVLASSGLIDQIYATRLGAVRLAEQWDVTDACTEEQVTRLVQFVDQKLKKIVGKPPFVPHLLYGTGGTFTALASMILARKGQEEQPLWGFRVQRDAIRHLVADLAQLSIEERCKVPGLNPRRADIIVAGLAILERIMRHLRVNTIQVHTRGVRDGLLLTMIEQAAPRPATPDQRLAAVEQFAQSCGVDLPHARHVSRIAGQLYAQIAEPLEMDPNDRELLEAAALVANVGYLINFDKHHKHSYHLILNSELPGFERRQLRLLAHVARYHRGASPKMKHESYGNLTSKEQQQVSRLAATLRLALALDRTHQQQVESVHALVTNDRVEITVEAKGNAEVDLWAARRKVQLFEKVFGRKVLFTCRPRPA